MSISRTQTRLLQFNDTKRTVANLMARENITVQVIDGAPSASFDVTRRVLTIPNWATLTVEQTDLLIAHEIGHALFTPSATFEKIAKDKRSLFGYVNIIEDARVERKMKASFPGLARTFYTGYQQFHTDGPILQGTRDALLDPKTQTVKKIAAMKLIDRINLYYKIGAFVSVPFDATERPWIDKIDKATGIDQVVDIARALHKLAKEQDQKNQPQDGGQTDGAPQAGDGDQSEDSEGDDQESNDKKPSKKSAKPAESDESDDSDSSESNDANSDDDADAASDDDGAQSTAAPKKQKRGPSTKGDQSKDDGDDERTKNDQFDESDDDDAVAPETSTATDEALKALADATNTHGDVQIRHLLATPVDDKTFTNRTIPAQVWAKMVHDNASKNAVSPASGFAKLDAAWMSKYATTAKAMALEFERKKSAKAFAQIKTAKTGKLNLNKLSQYRFTEDLFLRSQTIPNGKSHGVVMVIDASGSMMGCFPNVLDQVLLFALFAHQVQIPFEAYMFTDQPSGYSSGYSSRTMTSHTPGQHTIALSDEGRLVGLVSTKTGTREFKAQVAAVLALRARHYHDVPLDQDEKGILSDVPWSSLGGTPLYTGVMLGEKALANMKRTFRLDKTTFLVVTDGGDTAGLYYQTNTLHSSGKTIASRERVGMTGVVVRDTVTKKNFAQVDEQTGYDGKTYTTITDNGVITLLLDIMKARLDCRTMYLYLQSGSYGYARRRYGRRRAGQVSTDGLRQMTRPGCEDAVTAVPFETFEAEMKKSGQFVLPKDAGIADLNIVLKSETLGLQEDAFGKLNTNTMSQKKVASAFTKAMVGAVTNRVFVNTVVPYLA